MTISPPDHPLSETFEERVELVAHGVLAVTSVLLAVFIAQEALHGHSLKVILLFEGVHLSGWAFLESEALIGAVFGE